MFPTKADINYYLERRPVPKWVGKVENVVGINYVINAHAGIKLSTHHHNVISLLRLWQSNRRNEGVSDSYTDFFNYISASNDGWRSNMAKRVIRNLKKHSS